MTGTSLIDAVILDCDGVLVDSEALGLEASTTYLASHGFTWSPKDLVQMFTGFRDDVFAKKLTAAYHSIHHKAPPQDFFDGLVETRRSRRHLLQPIAGANIFLETLQRPMAVASSSRDEFLQSKLKRTNLHQLLTPHIYSADLVEHGKPAPDIFLYAAEKLGVAPKACLVIEDSANGVKAGIAANMTTWGFVGGGHCFEGHGENLKAAGASKIVKDFASLQALLADLPTRTS